MYPGMKSRLEEEEEEPYLEIVVRCCLPRVYPFNPTAPISRSFGLRSSYEIDILDTDQLPRKKSRRCCRVARPRVPDSGYS